LNPTMFSGLPAKFYTAFFLCGITAFNAFAQAPAAVVHGVQSPAWLERPGSGRMALSPGMELKAGDQVRTGAQSRLLLKMAEGSLFKLGENGFMRVEEIKANDGGVFRATLRVAEGALRFTTDALAKNRRRDVNITVATVTAGIRGTDLWGKSEPNRQIVCLIEGRIEIRPEGEGTITMGEPLQFYVREGGRSLPVAAVDPKQLAQWALETEIAAGRGALRSGGRWKLTLATANSQAEALDFYDRLQAGGYAAEIRPVRGGETFTYEVRIANLQSKAEAEALASQLKGRMGIVETRVSG